MDKYEDDERSEQSDREDSDSSFGDSDDRPDSETGTAKDFAVFKKFNLEDTIK